MNTKDILRHFMFYINDKAQRETLVIKVSPDEHITVQLRHRERLVDIHKTKELPGGGKVRETLYQITFFKAYRLMLRLRRVVEDLQASLQNLEDAKREFPFLIKNPGWFRRHFMVAMPMDIKHLTNIGLVRVQKQGKRFKLGKDVENIDPDQIIMHVYDDLKAGQYLVMKWNKKLSLVHCGHLHVVHKPKRVFVFVPKQTVNGLMKRLAAPFIDELLRAGTAEGDVILKELTLRDPRQRKATADDQVAVEA